MTQTIEQLTARVRELEEEKKELQALFDFDNERLDQIENELEEVEYLGPYVEGIKVLKKQLAASQLHAEQLREALKMVTNKVCWSVFTDSEETQTEEALSQPTSTEALGAYVAEKVMEAGQFDNWKANPYTKILEQEVATLTRQRDLAVERLKADHEAACVIIADMHAAATGEITGPRLGVVEDVADIRKQLAVTQAELSEAKLKCKEQRNDRLVLRNQLIAAQAAIKVKDRLLKCVGKHIQLSQPDTHKVISKTLSTPADTSALDAYVAEKVKEEQRIGNITTVPSHRLRELTLQRDLAVEALQFFMDHGICEATYYKVREALSTIKGSEK